MAKKTTKLVSTGNETEIKITAKPFNPRQTLDALDKLSTEQTQELVKQIQEKMGGYKKEVKGVNESPVAVSEVLKHKSLRLALQAYEHFCKPERRMVVVYAHAHLYKDSPRHALVVKKRPGTIHAGLFNLPGGHIQPGESPEAAALRELKEECGVEGTSPQLVGAILPSGRDANIDNFIVYVYRCVLAPVSRVSYEPEQPASWELIEQCRDGRWVPGLSIILPLLAANVMGFVVQDNDDFFFDPKNGASQSVVTFLQHTVSDAASQTKQRFTT